MKPESNYYSYEEYDPYEDYGSPYEMRERYKRGYVAEQKNSYRAKSSLEDDAEEDFSRYLEQVEEKSYSRGYSEGSDDSYANQQADFDSQDRLVRELERQIAQLDPKRVKALEANNDALQRQVAASANQREKIIAEMAFRLGELLDTSETPVHDVEAWAYQDGRNEVIKELMDWLNTLREAK